MVTSYDALGDLSVVGIWSLDDVTPADLPCRKRDAVALSSITYTGTALQWAGQSEFSHCPKVSVCSSLHQTPPVVCLFRAHDICTGSRDQMQLSPPSCWLNNVLFFSLSVSTTLLKTYTGVSESSMVLMRTCHHLSAPPPPSPIFIVITNPHLLTPLLPFSF